MEANKEYETARSEKMKYEAHFVDFPMMKERYGGAYTRAKEEQAKAIEEWKAKGQQIDLFFNTILRLIRDQRDQEDIARKAAENVVQERLPDAPGIAELREEMKALREETKKRDTEMDAYIKTAVGKIEAKQTFLNSLKTQMDDMKVKIQNLHNEVHDAEQLALAASDHMQKLTSLAARVEKVTII
jgi:DNA repair exonuclease SbcCD ATPase subunit